MLPVQLILTSISNEVEVVVVMVSKDVAVVMAKDSLRMWWKRL
jgi:hypothetical protein